MGIKIKLLTRNNVPAKWNNILHDFKSVHLVIVAEKNMDRKFRKKRKALARHRNKYKESEGTWDDV